MDPDLKKFMILMLEAIRLIGDEVWAHDDETKASWAKLDKDVLRLQNKLVG